ncbi:DNA-directed RNA polymerase subunit omega [Rhizobium giardinii]|uniref:DNA-directed RNA polymerase subunit omega n=1 Tax=Rhizobium giardinii TaxID=56731 RepID=UPI003D7005D6
MDPHVVFDCQKVMPNRFALTLAAAARSRALARGAEPRLDAANRSVSELALHEIAAGVFRERELAPFLPGTDGRRSLPPPDPGSKLRDGGSARAAAAPASRALETFH